MVTLNRYSQPHGEKTGAYGLVVRASRSIVNPNDRVNLELYISGYGQIKNACVGVYPSWSIFDIEKSRVSIGEGVAVPMDPLGVIVNISDQSVFDAKGPFQISTECKTPPPASRAPISLDMQIDPKAPPGAHSIQFSLKYFNGESWDTRTYATNITVRNFYQRHETVVWGVGGVAACLSIIKDIYPALKLIVDRLFCPQ